MPRLPKLVAIIKENLINSFDEEFNEYLQHHKGIPKPSIGGFEDLTIQRFHLFYNLFSIKELLLNSQNVQWKTSIRNKLAEIVEKYQAGKDLFMVELTDPELEHKIFVDSIELSDKEIKKLIAIGFSSSC